MMQNILCVQIVFLKPAFGVQLRVFPQFLGNGPLGRINFHHSPEKRHKHLSSSLVQTWENHTRIKGWALQWLVVLGLPLVIKQFPNGGIAPFQERLGERTEKVHNVCQMLSDLIVAVGQHPPVKQANSTVHLDNHCTWVPKINFCIPRGLDQDLGSPKSDGLNVFRQMVVGPARHTPVAQGDIELTQSFRVHSEIMSSQRQRFDGGIPSLSLVLPRDGFSNEVLCLDAMHVWSLNKNKSLNKIIVGFDVYGSFSLLVHNYNGFSRELPTSMDHVTLVSKLQGSHKLQAELSHNICRHQKLLEPDAESPRFSPMSSNTRQHVVAIGALELESTTTWQTYP
jgi:hypothetical protein